MLKRPRKRCPKCNKTYSAEKTNCPKCGSQLVSFIRVSAGAKGGGKGGGKYFVSGAGSGPTLGYMKRKKKKTKRSPGKVVRKRG